MLNIVIFDDEPESTCELRRLTDQALPHSSNHHILEVNTLDELTALLLANDPIDILIADIVMPKGQPSGIDVVRRLFPPESGTQVIYVSGYLDKSLDVYPTNHVYFLLKPVDPNKLGEALSIAIRALGRRQPTMLRIKIGHKVQLINTASITHLASNLRKATIYCKNTDQYETYARLDDLQPQLPASFIRCHRSYIVNLSYVASLRENFVTLHDGTQIPVSRRRAKDVQRALLARISGRA